MKKILFIFFWVTCLAAFGQQADSIDYLNKLNPAQANTKEFSGINDTLNVDKKNFDNTLINKLKSDPELNYQQPATVAESLWGRFLAWLMDSLESLFRNATTTGLGQMLLYVAAIILLIVITMLLLKVDALKVFYSGADRGKIKHDFFHENIHEMDFEKLIREATEKGEYRLGVRLIFLYALKMLADKHLIDWQAGKTNHDYVEEVRSKDLKTELNELSFYFDYAWYGGFSIDRSVFGKVEDVFNSWKMKVNE